MLLLLFVDHKFFGAWPILVAHFGSGFSSFIVVALGFPVRSLLFESWVGLRVVAVVGQTS